MDVEIDVTGNHLGYFQFRICPAPSKRKDPSQKCFDRFALSLSNRSYAGTVKSRFFSSRNLLRVLPNMSDRYEVTSSRNGIYKVRVQLPEKLTCKHCIIQVI